jgi:serine/threonine protein kinase
MKSKMTSNCNGILDGQYILEDEIGDGGTANVYKAKDFFSNKYYAVKIFKEYSDTFEKEILFNQQILQSKNHCHFFIKFISSSLHGTLDKDGFKETKCYILYELASKGDLFNYVFSNETGLNEKNCKIISYKILKALQALHEIGILHRDIKLQNILLDGERYDIKIGDFGFSSFIKEENESNFKNEIVGTDEYMPPEVYLKLNYSGVKSDIYSTGILLFNLLKCLTPFPIDKKTKKIKFYSFFYHKKEEQYWEMLEREDLKFSPEFKDLFEKMVSFNPRKRPTIEEILNHDWMKEITNLNEEEFKQYEENLISELKEREEILKKQK